MIVENVEGFVTSTLAGDAYVQVHKRFMRAFEGDATLAVVLSELISLHALQKARSMVDDLGQFPFPICYMEDQLGISEYKQRNALKRLQAANLLTFVVMGKPASRYVSLNFEAIARLVASEDSARKAEQEEKNSFYRNISTNAGDPELLDASLDNIREPLRGCMHIMSSYIFASYGQVEWTPEAVGLLKRVVRIIDKEELFDYGHFSDMILSVPLEIQASAVVKRLLKAAKRIPARSPCSRNYDWRSFI